MSDMLRSEFELATALDAPSAARRAVAEFDGVSDGAQLDAQLVVSELVNNALLHADPSSGGTILVRLHREGERLLIEVDHRRGRADGAPHVPLDDERHRGGFSLRIVDELAETWQASDTRVSAWLRS